MHQSGYSEFPIFSKLKGHNYVKHHQTGTKFQLYLYFLVNNIHMKYQLYMCIPSKVREQKLWITHFFQSLIHWTQALSACISAILLNVTPLECDAVAISHLRHTGHLSSDEQSLRSQCASARFDICYIRIMPFE